jgi:hypothetical protein
MKGFHAHLFCRVSSAHASPNRCPRSNSYPETGLSLVMVSTHAVSVSFRRSSHGADRCTGEKAAPIEVERQKWVHTLLNHQEVMSEETLVSVQHESASRLVYPPAARCSSCAFQVGGRRAAGGPSCAFQVGGRLTRRGRTAYLYRMHELFGSKPLHSPACTTRVCGVTVSSCSLHVTVSSCSLFLPRRKRQYDSLPVYHHMFLASRPSQHPKHIFVCWSRHDFLTGTKVQEWLHKE